MSGKVRDEDAPATGEKGRQLGEVHRRATEPVDDDQRRPLSAHEIAGTDATNLRYVRLKPSKERCLGHR
jgi:hypothetical protein